MLKYHIQTVEVGSGGATTIQFHSIPQDYNDLYLVLSGRSTRSLVNDYVALRFNNSTTGFTARILVGNGSSATAGTETSFGAPRILGDIPGSTATSNTFGSLVLSIPNYSGSSAKSFSAEVVTENNGTTAYQELTAGLWSGTEAINSIVLEPIAGGTNSFVQYSSASLYGVKRGSDGVVNYPATGGVVTTSGGYTIHTFNSSGTFKVEKPLTVEYLVIGGGGSGGSAGGQSSSNAGGGGAGGYRSSVAGELSGANSSAESALFLSPDSYAITVGAGGAAVKADNVAAGYVGKVGNNSTFSTITSIGGGGGAFSPTYAAASVGGSGGGGAYSSAGAGSAQPGAAGTTNQGFAGGSGSISPRHGGGGGGAGAVGFNGDSSNGAGGSGISSSITGTATFRAGGGGQGNVQTGTSGAGGNGGGGAGAYNTTATSGTANTGGGGGANAFTNLNNNYFSGAGGSGVVIIRYLTP